MMDVTKALRFAIFPTWQYASAAELQSMDSAWQLSLGEKSGEVKEALATFRTVSSDPVFAQAQNALFGHIQKMFELIGQEELNDASKLIQPISSLSGIRIQKLGGALKRLQEALPKLPAGELRQEVESALQVTQSPEWKTAQETMNKALGQIRTALGQIPAYQETQAALAKSFKAVASLQDHIFNDGIDHGVLADHPWLIDLKKQNPALFSQVIEAKNEQHIHVRRCGLNNVDTAQELLSRRLGVQVVAAEHKSEVKVVADEMVEPELDAAKLARGGAGKSSAELAMKDLKKLGIIATAVGVAIAGAALINRHASRTAEPSASWQEKTRDKADAVTLSP